MFQTTALDNISKMLFSPIFSDTPAGCTVLLKDVKRIGSILIGPNKGGIKHVGWDQKMGDLPIDSWRKLINNE